MSTERQRLIDARILAPGNGDEWDYPESEWLRAQPFLPLVGERPRVPRVATIDFVEEVLEGGRGDTTERSPGRRSARRRAA